MCTKGAGNSVQSSGRTARPMKLEMRINHPPQKKKKKNKAKTAE
jgi:hypothetical protein